MILPILGVVLVSCGAGEPRASRSPAPQQDSAGPSASSEPCDGTTTLELEEACASDLEATERFLDAVLAEVRVFYAGEQRRALEESEGRWVAYRDSYCGVLAIDGGSIAAVNVLKCKVDLPRQRIETLCAWLAPNAPLDALAGEFPKCRRVRND